MHAVDFLKDPKKHLQTTFLVLGGSEAHLRHAALTAVIPSVLGSDASDDLAVTRFSGKDADWRTVHDELRTVSMWTDSRLVLIEDADDFVSAHRSALEDLADSPPRSATLVLQVSSWRSTTKLAKKLDQTGLFIECAPLAGGRLISWLVGQAADVHEKRLSRTAAQLMLELAGTAMGLLDQELGKLASYVGDRETITDDDVRRLVGGWKAETTWTMLNAVRDGHAGVALACLDKLLASGEAPQRILGGINFVFTKFARATERSRMGTPLPVALKEAGVFPRDVDVSSAYLRRIGRPRAEHLWRWLQEADSDMKGASRLPDRVQLERLLLRLAGS